MKLKKRIVTDRKIVTSYKNKITFNNYDEFIVPSVMYKSSNRLLYVLYCCDSSDDLAVYLAYNLFGLFSNKKIGCVR